MNPTGGAVNKPSQFARRVWLSHLVYDVRSAVLSWDRVSLVKSGGQRCGVSILSATVSLPVIGRMVSCLECISQAGGSGIDYSH